MSVDFLRFIPAVGALVWNFETLKPVEVVAKRDLFLSLGLSISWPPLVMKVEE